MAHTIAVGLGAKPLADAAAGLAHRSRLRLDPTARTGARLRCPGWAP